MGSLRDWAERTLNLSGGVYVGIATFTVLGLAVAEYAAGIPQSFIGADGKPVIYMLHKAPEWFVEPIGVYTVILALFWAGKPIKTMVDASKTLTEAKAEAVKNAPLKPKA